MNIEKMDRIIMTKDDVDKLFEWRDNHKEYVRRFKPVLKQAVIAYKDIETEIVFNDIGMGVQYVVYRNGKRYHEFLWSRDTMMGRVVFTLFGEDEDWQFEYNQTLHSLHASLMAYMEYYSDKKEYVVSKSVSIPKHKKSKKGGVKKSKRVVNIKRKVYIVNVDDNAIKRDKRRYERKTEGWTVRGFWRTSKLGNRHWVDSYPKGNKRKIEPKTYKLDD